MIGQSVSLCVTLPRMNSRMRVIESDQRAYFQFVALVFKIALAGDFAALRNVVSTAKKAYAFVRIWTIGGLVSSLDLIRTIALRTEYPS
jgi:hypothetical protein